MAPAPCGIPASPRRLHRCGQRDPTQELARWTQALKLSLLGPQGRTGCPTDTLQDTLAPSPRKRRAQRFPPPPPALVALIPTWTPSPLSGVQPGHSNRRGRILTFNYNFRGCPWSQGISYPETFASR